MNTSDISKETIRRYSQRYEDLGRNVRTLGWGDEQQQQYRFSQTLSSSDFRGKSVIDIGCGFGDYLDFLHANEIGFHQYRGCDINHQLIEEAKKSSREKADFFVFDLATEKNSLDAKSNIGVMLGLLNFNLRSTEVNIKYSELMISKAFEIVDEVLIVDFLSTAVTPDYPKEDLVFYHNPGDMLNFALTLTSKVTVKHDYSPIPQKEFMLFLYK